MITASHITSYSELNIIISKLNNLKEDGLRVVIIPYNGNRKPYNINNEEIENIVQCINHLTKVFINKPYIHDKIIISGNIQANYLSMEHYQGQYNNCITISREGERVLVVDMHEFKLNLK